MPYMILAYDHEDMDILRDKTRAAHRAYLKKVGTQLLAAGALFSDDGTTVIGGMMLLDTSDRQVAQTFADNDPYEKAGIRITTDIIQWQKKWWNGTFIE